MKRAAWITLAAFTIAGFVVPAIGEHYRLGLDLQKRQCLPWWSYLIKFGRPDSIQRGDILAFRPRGEPLVESFSQKLFVKKIGAIPGDLIEVKEGYLFINSQPVGPLELTQKLKVAKTAFDRIERVPAGHYFFIGTEPRSYDSRYWGFVPEREIIGSALPIL